MKILVDIKLCQWHFFEMMQCVKCGGVNNLVLLFGGTVLFRGPLLNKLLN